MKWKKRKGRRFIGNQGKEFGLPVRTVQEGNYITAKVEGQYEYDIDPMPVEAYRPYTLLLEFGKHFSIANKHYN